MPPCNAGELDVLEEEVSTAAEQDSEGNNTVDDGEEAESAMTCSQGGTKDGSCHSMHTDTLK